ncbi:MAG: hypothetical protein RIR18_494 [Pseudomonadota bacterium]|jgi:ATPase subunit of ABC transporter with duplicated ATPase domains
MNSVLLRLDNLKTGWATPMVGPVSLQVKRGEVVGLCGPNGIGKSTVLAAISGSATVFSGGIWRAPDCKVTLQTQQQPSLQGLPLNGHELLALTGASPAGLPHWLTDKLTHRVDTLSGGQRQYLVLWAVLNSDADLILLDEPSNNLDVAGSQHLATAIRARAQRAKNRGAGVLLVSHEAELLAVACDRCVELGESKIEGQQHA